MELRHLRYFIAVAEEEHAGRAAARLGVSQPALSQQIKDLEAQVGVPLFERHARGMRLTQAGQEFLKHAQAVIASASVGVERARAVGQGMAGRLRLGLPETRVALSRITPAIERFRANFPGVELEITGIPWLEQPLALLQESLDVGFCWSAGPATSAPGRYASELESARLLDDPGEYALIPADHPLVACDPLTPAHLAAWPFSPFERRLHPSLYDAILDALRQAGVMSKPLSAQISTTSGGVSVLVAQQGWALITRNLALDPPPGTVARRIQGFSLAAGLDVLWRANDVRPALEALIAELRDGPAERPPA
jgi:DNA-binding transcriptional LysR family regulator